MEKEKPKSDDPNFDYVQTIGGDWKKVTMKKAKLIRSIPPIEELLQPITEEEIEAAK